MTLFTPRWPTYFRIAFQSVAHVLRWHSEGSGDAREPAEHTHCCWRCASAATGRTTAASRRTRLLQDIADGERRRMSPEDLLSYYERELTFLRQYVREFAAHYPKIASRLSLTGGMDSGRAAQMSAAVTVPRGTQLYSRPLNGSKILFRTAYDVTLSPLQLTGAQFRSIADVPRTLRLPAGATALISLTFAIQSAHPSIAELDVDSIRLYTRGAPGLTAMLRDALSMKTLRAYVEPAHGGPPHERPGSVGMVRRAGRRAAGHPAGHGRRRVAGRSDRQDRRRRERRPGQALAYFRLRGRGGRLATSAGQLQATAGHP
ncbi:type VI secretion system baseplate subunit TssF [Burkholderia cepacia]|uniref:type VI secretion system baseplate subunit TssF n=1 Tax=Burkholderia cepacia TaxID=292 RepID=UPI001E4B9776|nr:type VI secretion system baseplate subunit TssF [Burkholderia cepacia]